MSISEGKSNRKRRRKRGITRRVVDEHGNVIVKRYTRRQSKIRIPGLTARKIPSLMLGLVFGFYAMLAYYESKGVLANSENSLLQYFHEFFLSMNPVVKIFAAGTIGIALSTFFGYAFFTQGFKIKNWGKAFRQLVSILLVILVASSILSPFLTEPGIVRQISDEDFQPRTDEFDLSGLNSPFYDELLNSFLDLLGGLDPDIAYQVVANITPTDSFGLDPTRDIYLFRWQVSETWDPVANDFIKADETTILPFSGFDPGTQSLDPDSLRSFEVDNAYLTAVTSYSQPLVSFWNSEEGATIANTSQFSLKSSNPDIQLSSLDVNNDVNEQPIVNAKFSEASSSGAISFPAWWKAEDVQGISSGAVSLGELESLFGQAPSDRFPSSKLANNGEGISNFWGRNSLPKNYIWADQELGKEDAFTRKYNEFDKIFTESTSVYAAIMTIHTFIQNAVLEAFNNNYLNFDPIEGQGDFAGTTDKGHYFYEAIENNLPWGLREMLPGYVNMLRSFGIPARVVLGFAGGTIDSSKITLQMLNRHYWVEALIPWRDDTGTLHWSWGILNPVPIFSALQSEQIAYGRNALGGGSSLKVDVVTGEESVSGVPIKLQQMGENFQVNISADFSGVPASGQNIQLKLLDDNDQSQLLSGTLPTDLSNFGLDLPSITLNDRGYYLLNGTVDYEGNMTVNGTEVTTIKPININAALNPGLGEPVNGYAILALFGFTYNFTAIAWLKNGTLVASFVGLQTSPIPGVDAPGTVVTPTVQFSIASTLYKADGATQGNEIVGENLTLLLYTQTQYENLDLTSLTDTQGAKTYAEGILDAQTPATQQTDTQGSTQWDITFPLNDPSYPVDDEIYIFIVQWEGSTVFSLPLSVLVSLRAQMDTVSYFNTSVLSSGQTVDTWYSNITLTSLAGVLIDPLPIHGVPVDILLVNKLDFDNAGVTTYSDLQSFLSGQTEGTTFYNLSNPTLHPNVLTLGGVPITDNNGFVQAQIKIAANEIAAGFFYYILAVADEFSIFTILKNGTDTTNFQFGVAGAPSLQDISITNPMSIEIVAKYEDKLELDLEGQK